VGGKPRSRNDGLVANGDICTGATYKNVVKLTFFKGAL